MAERSLPTSLRSVMAERGLSQTEAATQIGVHSSTIAKWLRELRFPSRAEQHKLLALGWVDTYDLFAMTLTYQQKRDETWRVVRG